MVKITPNHSRYSVNAHKHEYKFWQCLSIVYLLKVMSKFFTLPKVVDSTRAEEVEKSIIWRFIESIPALVPVFIAVFGAASVALLLMGALTNILVLGIALPAGVLACYIIAKHFPGKLPGSIKERRFVGIAMLAIILIWIGFNINYASQNIFINRDPGIYNVVAEWLIDKPDLVIQSSEVFGDNPDIVPSTAGFETVTGNPERLYPQAPHLLPVLLALAGRAMGLGGMLQANVAIGGLALLSLYGLTRFFVRPKWALLATTVLAVSLPMIYFSRDTYSEPLTLLLIFGGLSLVFIAQLAGSRLVWFLAGVAASAGVLVRADAYLVLASFLLGSFLLTALAASGKRREALGNSMSFIIGLGIVAFIGWMDLTLLSLHYYNALETKILIQIGLIALILVFGPLLILLAWRYQLLKFLYQRTKRWLPIAAVGAIILFSLFLLTRPLWDTAYGASNQYSRAYVASLQQRDGDPIMPTRSYAEYTAYWIMWYIGPVAAALAVAGLSLLAYGLLRHKKKLVIMLLLVFGTTALLYLISPRITPDQIWASRRFLPIVFPALCLFAAVALQRLADMQLSKKVKVPLLSGVIILILTPPLFISYPFLTHKEFAGQLNQVNEICSLLPDDAAVLLLGGEGVHMTQTIRTHCNVPAERLRHPSEEALAEAATAARDKGLVPIAFIVGYELPILPEGSNPTLVSKLPYSEMKRELEHPPRVVERYTRSLFLGEINRRGEINPFNLKG